MIIGPTTDTRNEIVGIGDIVPLTVTGGGAPQTKPVLIVNREAAAGPTVQPMMRLYPAGTGSHGVVEMYLRAPDATLMGRIILTTPGGAPGLLWTDPAGLDGNYYQAYFGISDGSWHLDHSVANSHRIVLGSPDAPDTPDPLGSVTIYGKSNRAGLVIRAGDTPSEPILDVQMLDGTSQVQVTEDGTLQTLRLASTGLGPALTPDPGAGTGPALSILAGGTDLAGIIEVVAGTAPAPSATVVTVTFATVRAAAPQAVILTPANDQTALLCAAGMPFVASASLSPTTFKVEMPTGMALAAAGTYQWYYLIIG